MSDYFEPETGERLSDADLEARYDEMLDDVYGTVNVGADYDASAVLKAVDPIAYRCGFSDWLDSEVQNGALWDECWTVGDNQPGYLPDSEPRAYGTWEDAWEALRSELLDRAEDDAETVHDEVHDDDVLAEAARVIHMLDEEDPLPGKDVSIVAFNRVFWLTSEGE